MRVNPSVYLPVLPYPQPAGHAPAAAQASEPAAKSTAQTVAGDIGRHTWFIPGLSNMLLGAEKSDGSVGGVLDGLKNGFDKTLNDGLGTSLSGAASGNLLSVIKGYGEAVMNNEATPKLVRTVLGGLLKLLG